MSEGLRPLKLICLVCITEQIFIVSTIKKVEKLKSCILYGIQDFGVYFYVIEKLQ
jgi:hypothetical protein